MLNYKTTYILIRDRPIISPTTKRSPLVRYQQTAIAPSSPYNKAIAFTKYQKLRSPHNLPNHKAIAPSSPHQKAIASNQ
uniref:hypothetical protein n=1 Tax=Pseudanabaena sp. 'Roaring Creek' TaxID=1681830 RepID=UPI000A7A880A